MPPTTAAKPNAIKDPSNLGNVLLEMGVVTLDKLKDAVIQQMHERGETHLGEVLKAMGAISDIDLAAALRVQTLLRQGDVIGAHLVVLDFQTQRIDRSLVRSEAAVDAGNAALDKQCAGCPRGLPECEHCPRAGTH